jgi:hypothetical protein
MKIISRGILLALVLVLTLSMAPTANAAVDVKITEPGETVSFTLEYTDACAVEGEIIFSDPSSIITNKHYDVSQCGMDGQVANNLIFLYSDHADGVDGKIVVTFAVHSAAKQGSSCTVTFRYAVTAPGSDTPGKVKTVTYMVTVSTGGQVPPTPVDPPDDPGDKPPVVHVDTSALLTQIKVAESLTYYDYTRESWADVESALENARQQLDSTSQSSIDVATQSLKLALANLVSVDYTALQAALDSTGNLISDEAVEAQWQRFITALANARTQRTSGDQAAVDAATAELLASKAELEKALESMGKLIEVEKKVEVEVEPDYDYCNILFHNVILVIMIISLVLNVVLICLIAAFFYKKHKNQQDNTPLVDYDISDDMVDMNEDILE